MRRWICFICLVVYFFSLTHSLAGWLCLLNTLTVWRTESGSLSKGGSIDQYRVLCSYTLCQDVLYKQSLVDVHLPPRAVCMSTPVIKQLKKTYGRIIFSHWHENVNIACFCWDKITKIIRIVRLPITFHNNWRNYSRYRTGFIVQLEGHFSPTINFLILLSLWLLQYCHFFPLFETWIFEIHQSLPQQSDPRTWCCTLQLGRRPKAF